jgi:hypothetical protein
MKNSIVLLLYFFIANASGQTSKRFNCVPILGETMYQIETYINLKTKPTDNQNDIINKLNIKYTTLTILDENITPNGYIKVDAQCDSFVCIKKKSLNEYTNNFNTFINCDSIHLFFWREGYVKWNSLRKHSSSWMSKTSFDSKDIISQQIDEQMNYYYLNSCKFDYAKVCGLAMVLTQKNLDEINLDEILKMKFKLNQSISLINECLLCMVNSKNKNELDDYNVALSFKYLLHFYLGRCLKELGDNLGAIKNYNYVSNFFCKNEKFKRIFFFDINFDNSVRGGVYLGISYENFYFHYFDVLQNKEKNDIKTLELTNLIKPKFGKNKIPLILAFESLAYYNLGNYKKAKQVMSKAGEQGYDEAYKILRDWEQQNNQN